MTDVHSNTAGDGRTKPGRPRSAGMDEAIVEAGWRVLNEAGYAGLTFEAVAREAGCSRPALYRRFASKRDLVMALINASARRIEPDLSAVDDPRQHLIEHACGLVAYLALPAGAGTMALAQARRNDPELDAALEDSFKRERIFYEEAMAAAAAGALSPKLARLFIEALLGAIIFRVALRNRAMTRAEVTALVDGALDAIKGAARRKAKR